MRSRATTYMLILAMLGVWGVVVWRLVDREDTPVAARARAPMATGVYDSLLLDYRDPFLDEAVVEHEQVLMPQETPLPKPESPKVQHRLRYLGRISREGRIYGLVEIDGLLHTLRCGEAANGYMLETVWQDSVKLRWRGEICVVGC